MNQKRYRAAAIGHTGAGNYGHGLHLAYRRLENVEFIAISDPDPVGREKAAMETDALRNYTDYREMLEKEDLDIVSVCPRWVTDHVEMVLACLKSGCHVYCEKPMTANLADGDLIVETAKQKGHQVDFVDLYKEKFNPVFSGEKPDAVVIDHQKRIEKSDTIVLIAPIWNFRMPAILEGWIDKVLAPPWAFSFKKLFGNYGYPIGNLEGKKAIVFCTYGSPQFAIRTFFLNMPTKRLRRGVFNICGIKDVTYKRYFAVPFVTEEKRKKFLEDVKSTASKL